MKFHLQTKFGMFILISATILFSATCAYSNESTTDGSEARNVLTKQVKQMFQGGKFAELDQMADTYRTTKARFTDGQWKLMTFYTSFDLGTRTPEWVFPTYIALAQKWRSLRPQSVTAQCVLAGLWDDYAWRARGDGYANKVKDETWPLVYERLDTAWGILTEPSKPGAPDCPRRHYLLLVVAKAKGIELKEVKSIFRDAISQTPDYYHHYVAMADYLLPQWHGKEGDWQRFITKVAEQNPGGEGATIYTRTAWSLFLGNEWKDFKGSGVSWDSMKAGFQEIDHNYPGSSWILNWYARFACRAGDIETMKTLLQRIDTHNYDSNTWGEDKIEDCRSWAKLGKSKDEIEKEKLTEHMRQFETNVFKNLLELAEKGNRKVIGDLADTYLNGRGTAPDPVTAYAWLLQDEDSYKDRVAIIKKSLTPEQLLQAKGIAADIRKKISQQNK